MNSENRKQLKNVSWYFIGTLATAVLGLISTPFLTRVLSKEVYAQYGLIMSFNTALASFVYLGQDDAFMRFYHSRKAGFWSYFWKCVRIPVILCAVIVLLLLEPSKTFITFIMGEGISETEIGLICIFLAVTVIQRFLLLTARMEERAANYSISNVLTKGVFMIAVAVIFAYTTSLSFSFVLVALCLGVIVAMAVNILVATRVSHGNNPQGEDVSAIEMLKYGVPLAFTTTMTFAIPVVEKVIIRWFTSWETLAVYTSAAIFITVMNMIRTTVSNIWTPYAFKNFQNDQSFRHNFYLIGLGLSYFVTLIVAGTIMMRRFLVLILDKSYFDAYLIAPSMVCASCFDVVSTIYTIGVYFEKKTKYLIISPFVRMGISFISLVILLPGFGLTATGIGYLLSVAISRLLEMGMGLKLYSTGRNMVKEFSMFGISVGFSMASLFIHSLAFDVVSGIVIVLVSTVLIGKELRGMIVSYKAQR